MAIGYLRVCNWVRGNPSSLPAELIAPGAHRTNDCVRVMARSQRLVHNNALMRTPRATQHHLSYDNEFLPPWSGLVVGLRS